MLEHNYIIMKCITIYNDVIINIKTYNFKIIIVTTYHSVIINDVCYNVKLHNN